MSSDILKRLSLSLTSLTIALSEKTITLALQCKLNTARPDHLSRMTVWVKNQYSILQLLSLHQEMLLYLFLHKASSHVYQRKNLGIIRAIALNLSNFGKLCFKINVIRIKH